MKSPAICRSYIPHSCRSLRPIFLMHRCWSPAQRPSDTLVTSFSGSFKMQGFTGMRVANMDYVYVLCKYRLGWRKGPYPFNVNKLSGNKSSLVISSVSLPRADSQIQDVLVEHDALPPVPPHRLPASSAASLGVRG